MNSLDPRGGLAGLLAQRAAPDPPRRDRAAPSPAALRAAAGAVERGCLDWGRSVAAVGPIARDRRLGGRDRRAAVDLFWHVVRAQRLLELLLGRPDEGAPPDLLVRAAAVLFAGAPADLLDGDVLDAVLDPRHALLGHVLVHAPPAPRALGLAASLPDWFAAALLDRRAPEDAASLARALLGRAPLTLRAHRDRQGRDALAAELAASGIAASPSPLAPDALLLAGHPNVEALPAVRDGRASPQDAGSQLVAALVPPGRVLDACAGAGGKALALLSGGRTVVACDPRADALVEARRRAERAGLAGGLRTVVLPEGAALPAGVSPSSMDAVLVDAPCTGSGALRREPATRWTRPPTEFDRLPALQASILARVAPAVRPGGTLVYATCSLFARENDDVVAAFLAAHPSFALVPAAAALAEQGLDPTLAGDDFVRTTPHEHGADGFFAAVLRRTAP